MIPDDITSEESLTVAKKWVSELRQKGSPGMVIALAGNKLDMAVKRCGAFCYGFVVIVFRELFLE